MKTKKGKSKRGQHLLKILWDFSGQKITLEELFPEPLPAAHMQQRLWKYIKAKKLRVK